MEGGVNLAEQTRSLIDRLNVRQAMISNQLRNLTSENPGRLKKSKSVSFLDEQSRLKVENKDPNLKKCIPLGFFRGISHRWINLNHGQF